MRLTKTANVRRSADRVSERKVAVLEQNAIDAASETSRKAGDKKPGRSATATATVIEPVTPPAQPTPADDVETLYVQHRSLLLYVACRKFRVPETDAENLIQEVFLSFLQTGTSIDKPRAWLVAAMCNASRHYWRSSGRTESLPDDFNDHSDPDSQSLNDAFTMRMTVRQVLKYLQPRCRETLWLHYFEGRSAGDVARELQTTHRYAEKLIHNCLKRAREIYKTITTVNR
jgi:RNA polymerase sigma factor (sigma-70 family)